MKKFFLLLFVILICLIPTSCEKQEKVYPNPVIVEPDPQTYKTINGYKNETFSQNGTLTEQEGGTQTDSEAIKYIGNSETMKMHKSDCRYAKNLSQDKKVTLMDYSSGISAGYIPCKVCNK